ncbi:Choline dehydrogenase [Singulisphaera sp. GP187]|uniref:GMC family oxidoreductase n=1 Tax=Singulisphaera sp. GP187 TaxID=1882752 RepID=UPI0009259B13|nr:GMC family oxidoreductase [Singulisphaera sp. GP187]SIO57731.1 Choline dehydrogenase [Singulisphaera sp. GP187]
MSDVAEYDLIVVGAGVAGSLTAKHLTRAGFRVLVLEAGPATAKSLDGYLEHLDTFYTATGKGPESAWPPAPNAPQPDTSNLRENNGYFVQQGPNLYGSTYTRSQGGSTLHWLGVSLRMLPEDFDLRTRHGVGRDWPLSYEDLEPYYRKAERELGVAADVDEQRYHGLTFPAGYDYPMRRLPPSYSDQKLAAAIDGMDVSLGDSTHSLKVRIYPAARNSIPRGEYVPVGTVDERDDGQLVEQYLGQRCAGNTSCTPICPIQAKYNAGKTLAQADRNNLQVLSRAVASRIDIDTTTGEVQGITYQRYDDSGHVVEHAKARLYVLAAHAVENAKLMLASGLSGESGLVGKTLMDHPALYAWGLAPEPIGAYRGPLSTAGIEDLRAGPFRAKHAAFRFDIGNDGWKATTGAPDTAVANAVAKDKLFGRKLRDRLTSTLPRHVRVSLAIEQLPDPANCVTIDRRYLDPLGNPRPVIRYRIDDYTLAAMAAATGVYQQVFRKAGITDCTNPDESAWFPSVQYGDTTFHYHGMGHFSGTHAMGSDRDGSVVDSYQRSWEHRNLYLVGSGSFPTMGTSNPTLTLAALAIRTAEHLIAELKRP